MNPPLDLTPAKDSELFRRYTPFGDGREVTVRSGAARRPLGFPPRGARKLTLPSGREVVLTTVQVLLSPPPLRPGQAPMSREAAANYTPTYEYADVAGEQLCFPRSPRGFTTEEVDRFLTAFDASVQG